MPTKIFPAYLFLGEEEFLKEEALERLKARLLDSHAKELNYSVFYGKEKKFNIKGLLDNLNTLPFLAKKRIVVLKDADSLLASFKESVLLYLNSPKEHSVFIIENSSPNIKGKFLLGASKCAQLVYFRRLQDSELNSWLVKKVGSFGRKISVDAIKAIKENLPNDLRVLSSNIENVLLYIGKKQMITKDDVEQVMGVSPSHTATDLIANIEKKDVKKALRVFLTLKNNKKRETELLGYLAWNARMLLRMKYLARIKTKREISKELGLHFRKFDQMFSYVKSFKSNDLHALLDEILKVDVKIKTGSAPRPIMERLIVKMCL